MQLADFLQYLQARAVTRELATSLDEVLALRSRRSAA